MTTGYNIIASQEMHMGPDGVAFTPDAGTLDFVNTGLNSNPSTLDM